MTALEDGDQFYLLARFTQNNGVQMGMAGPDGASIIDAVAPCPNCFALIPVSLMGNHLEAEQQSTPEQPEVHELSPSPWLGTEWQRHGSWLLGEDRYQDGCTFDVPHPANEMWDYREETGDADR
jgi:hypothetical protein